MRVHLVVPLVCGVAVGQLERSGVAKGIKTLKPIYLGNGSLNVHVVLKALDAQLADLGRRVHSTEVMKEKHLSRLHLVKQERAS